MENPGIGGPDRHESLSVGAYAGHRYPDRPEWVEIDGVRVDIEELEREWREEDRLGFAVKLRDHRRMLLYYDPKTDTWNGTLERD